MYVGWLNVGRQYHGHSPDELDAMSDDEIRGVVDEAQEAHYRRRTWELTHDQIKRVQADLTDSAEAPPSSGDSEVDELRELRRRFA